MQRRATRRRPASPDSLRRLHAIFVAAALCVLAAALAGQAVLAGLLPPRPSTRDDDTLRARVARQTWGIRPRPLQVDQGLLWFVRHHAAKGLKNGYLVAIASRRLSPERRPLLIFRKDDSSNVKLTAYFAETRPRVYKLLLGRGKMRDLEGTGHLKRLSSKVWVFDDGTPSDVVILHEAPDGRLVVLPARESPSGLSR